MKKILTYPAMALLAIAVISGCSKKSDPPKYSLSATVAGSPYTAATCIAYTSGGTIEIEAETTTAGTTLTFPYIAMWLNGTTVSAQTYTFDSTAMTNYAEYLTSTTSFKIAKSGSVTITSVSSDNITGTFSFTCTDGTVITDGKFVAEKL